MVILNQGSSDVSLSGWKLKDEYGHTYTFPSFVLKAGNRVTVYTGSGTNTQDKLYWGRSSAVWNNDSDTVYLYDASMELVDWYGW